MKDFTDKQLKAIELIAVSEIEGYTMEEIAEMCCCSSRTLRRWKESKEFNKAVHIKTLEILAQQSPKALKNTLDFIDSKDVKVRLQGNTFYQKEIERLDNLRKQEQEAHEIDINEFLRSIDIETLETAHDKKRYLNRTIKEDIDKIRWGLGAVIYNKKVLTLMLEGSSWQEAEDQLKAVATFPEEYVKELNNIFQNYGLQVMIKENNV